MKKEIILPKLGVNIDHVATLRQARGVDYPSPIEAAKICIAAGAHSITAHLREDRRHIQDADVFDLKREVEAPLNLEMACFREIIDLACELRPQEICLVPEKREELTTEGGLNVMGSEVDIAEAVDRFKALGIVVSLFIDPDTEQLDAAARTGAQYVELHTGCFCNAAGSDADTELVRLCRAAEYGADIGLKINAGHGITIGNIWPILKIPHLDTLNIGHSIVSRAVFLGLPQAVSEMLKAMRNYDQIQGGDG